MRFEDEKRSEFDVRLQQVLDQRTCPDSDSVLMQLAFNDDDAAAQLRAAELIASPPFAVIYPSANFADRILAKIHAEDAAETKLRNLPVWRRKSFLYSGIGVALAASLAIALGMWNASPEPSQLAEKPSEEPHLVAVTPDVETGDPDAIEINEPLPQSLEDISKRLDVRQEKVAQLRSGLNPFRSTLNVTIHVIRSTVPNKSHPSQQRPVDGKPSTAVVNTRWIA